MVSYIGDFAEDATVYHYFNTFSSNDPSASVTATTLADTDIYVYKDGSITDLVTDGATVVIDFDGRTGIHKLTIDTSVHADYATGSDYMVIIEGATVDGGNITAAIFTFSIENRSTTKIYSDTTIIASDAVVITADIASLSTKQDSDMVVLDASHTKTQSDIVIVDDFLDTEVAAITSNLVIIASDTLAIEVDTSTTLSAQVTTIASDVIVVTTDIASLSTKQDSDMVVVAAAHTKTQSDIVIVDDFVDTEITAITSNLVIIASDTLAIEAAGGALTAAQASDLVAIESELIKVYSDTTVIEAAGGALTAAQASDLVAIESELIKVYSDTTVIEAAGGALTAAQASDLVAIESELIKVYSDTTTLETQIGTAGDGLTDLGGMSTGMKAEVQTEANDALVANHLDHLVSVQDAVADLSATASSFETGLTEASNAWDEAELTFISGNLSGQTRVITDYSVTNGTVTVNEAFTESPANTDAFIIRATHTHSTTQIADSVWDETLAGHVTADTAGLLLNDWQDGGRLDLILDTVASDVIVVTTDVATLSTKQDSDMVVVAAAHTKTQSDIVIIDDFLDTEIAAVTSNLVIIASDTLAIEVDTSTTLSAQITTIASDLVKVYSDTTIVEADHVAAGEPAQGAPGVSVSRGTKIDWLYKAWRNKTTQTATTWSLYDDAGSTVDTKSTVSDDATTLTVGEKATGP